jgi:hypothetical protein
MQPIACNAIGCFWIPAAAKLAWVPLESENRPVGPPVRPAAFYAPQDPWPRDVGGLQPDEIPRGMLKDETTWGASRSTRKSHSIA